MESAHDIVDCVPVLPAIPYQGGKIRLAPRIIELLRPIPHQTYVEPFCGAGGVFLRRPWRSKAEVINDISRDVATLFRVLQRHYEALMDLLKWQITSRAEFERLLAAAPDTLTDLERAARFLYLQRTAFGGKISGRNFGVSVGRPGRFDVTKLASVLEAVHERLAGVVIEALPFARLIERYDRAETLFYLDPPYYGCEGDYGPGVFQRSDFELLADLLRGISGRFVLSINDHPEVRRIFAAFEIAEVSAAYSISSAQAGRRQFSELIITPSGAS